MTRTTGATDAQIEAAARRRYNEINGYHGNEWRDRQTGASRESAITHMEKYAAHLVRTDQRIVYVDDLRMLVDSYLHLINKSPEDVSSESAVGRIQALIGEAE